MIKRHQKGQHTSQCRPFLFFLSHDLRLKLGWSEGLGGRFTIRQLFYQVYKRLIINKKHLQEDNALWLVHNGYIASLNYETAREKGLLKNKLQPSSLIHRLDFLIVKSFQLILHLILSLSLLRHASQWR